MPLAVCATPIGNLDDVTLRVLAELRAADVVLAEDTRHTRGLLERHGIAARLLSYHEHNEAARVAELLPRLAAGERLALVRMRAAGRSPTRACAWCAPRSTRARGDRAARAFRRRDRARRERLGGARTLSSASCRGGRRARGALAGDRGLGDDRLVAFESPKRLPATLRSLAAADPTREVAVCRELTKRFEEVVARHGGGARRTFRGAAERRDHARRRAVRGRLATSTRRARAAAVAELVAAGTPRRVAAEVVARLTDVSRNDLYRGLCDKSVIFFDNRANPPLRCGSTLSEQST